MQFESCEDESRDARKRVEDSDQLLCGFKASIFLDHASVLITFTLRLHVLN